MIEYETDVSPTIFYPTHAWCGMEWHDNLASEG